jgi:hypothetical protein
VLYAISNLVIADALPKSRQSLAGGVFNTVSQIGNSIGLAIAAAISSVSTGADSVKSIVALDENALVKGYQAIYYACIATFSIAGLISAVGLRKAETVGMKIE